MRDQHGYAVSLPGLFLATTFAALVLLLGRQIGFGLAACVVAVPVPSFVYLLIIRNWMKGAEVDYGKRNVLGDVALMGGLVAVTVCSIAAVIRVLIALTF